MNNSKLKKEMQERLIFERSKQRVQDFKQKELNEKLEEELKQKTREKIQPIILSKVAKYQNDNDPIHLLLSFYPKLNLNPYPSKPKDIANAFKRTLAYYHPDKNVHQSLEKKIENEEIFKVISLQKEKWLKSLQNKNF